MGCHLPGFRFFPTEQELLDFYLPNKLKNQRPDMERVIPVVDVYDYDPSHLPCISSGEARLGNEEMFFFCPRQRQEAHGGRPKRTTPSGYWKATGSPTQVIHNNRVIGKKKTMVFYEGKAPTGRKTSWKMNEYKAYEEQSSGGETRRSFDRRPIVAVAQENGGKAVMEEWVAAAAVGTPSNHDSICVKSAAVKEAPEVAMSWGQSVLSPAEHPKEIGQEGTVEAVVDDDTDLNLLLAFGEDVVSLFEFEPLL